ncbi:HupE/UreJ family protein [Solimonas variicoloris]|uniref:HupE/UreJ family protein n=1 Tax=Solimonas variicoloris TaxID=254408 RepID=UPI00037BB7A6|nr:HupE/UreJ family protein [Solimonas variicoloris]
MHRHAAKSLATLGLLAPAAAFAHPGHAGDAGLAAGLLHPLLGLDHLAAMLMIGVWAAQLGGHGRWLVPAAFVALSGTGSALAVAGWAPPAIESGIAASLLVLGLLVALAGRLPTAAAATLSGAFACFHGAAHGSEMPGTALPLAYVAGLLLASAVLHGVGYLVAARYARPALTRAAGAAAAAGGLLLALGGGLAA